MSASDPFYAVRDALEAEVQSTKVKFDDWQAQLQSVNTSSDTKFRLKHEGARAAARRAGRRRGGGALRRVRRAPHPPPPPPISLSPPPSPEVKRDLAKADEMCRKVKLAVSNIERNRAKYPHIDERELGARLAFVERLDAAVANMRATFGSRETAGKMEADARKELASRVARETDGAARGGSAYTKANADFIKEQGGAQATIRREQDVVLDKMSSSLDTLKEMSQAIDAELKDQEKMVDDIDKTTDEAQGKMDGALKSIEKMLKTKDRCQLITIFALVVIFVIGAGGGAARATFGAEPLR